jgi:hypothetical protein
MKPKVIWIAGVCLALVVAAVLLAMLRPADPLSQLGPYITSDRTRYYNAGTSRLRYGVASIPATSERFIDLDGGMRENDLITVVREYAARSRDWNISPQNSLPIFSERPPERFEAITAGRSWAHGGYSVVIRKPLSSWDLFVLRLQTLGKDPYDHSSR